MKTFCHHCKQQYSYRVEVVPEEDVIDGVSVKMQQKHAYCVNCGSEVFPEEIVDENTAIANDAYREASGSISVANMQRLLSMYNIGANPLSKLLKWGDNTFERQMKHTMPEHEKAVELKRLFDPYHMLDLLLVNRETLTEMAYNKALAATMERIIERQTAVVVHEKPKAAFSSKESAVSSSVTADSGNAFNVSEVYRDTGRTVLSSARDSVFAA